MRLVRNAQTQGYGKPQTKKLNKITLKWTAFFFTTWAKPLKYWPKFAIIIIVIGIPGNVIVNLHFKVH